MDFRERKRLLDPINNYLKSDDCSLENLLGLKASIAALDVSLGRRIKKVVREKDKLNSLIKIDREEEYLD